MKLIYSGRLSKEIRPYTEFNKIGAIKCVRNWTGMGLKESKEAIEEATSTGSAELTVQFGYDADLKMLSFNEEIRKVGHELSVTSEYSELTDVIERAIVIAVGLREYKTARALINTLPRALRSIHMGDIQE